MTNYERMGVAQIRRVAQGRGIEYAQYFRKHELVVKLQALDASEAFLKGLKDQVALEPYPTPDKAEQS